ncbi:MAG: prepilin-type N-terminal cleavage/methylation domain-containing protein, partial [Candidatus Aminicenantes bacterium]|nr:prepilin-type N-terminal cleavage/methylation domain-containing protein [Candidatus Aminicenantes bacterium]
MVQPIKRDGRRPAPRGMTLIELMIGSSIMLVVVLAALGLYMQSNKIAVDQQQVHEVQNDVRASMFLITRDVRMAGVGLDYAFNAYFLEGTDNEDQGADVAPDRILMMGNMEDPINVKIQNYQGSSANLAAEDYSIESYPYPDDFYVGKVVILMPNEDSGCLACEIRIITSVTHNADGSNEKFNFSPGLAPGIDPPGGLGDSCPDSDNWDGGKAAFINVKEYWLDVTGNHPSYAAGVNGYIG